MVTTLYCPLQAWRKYDVDCSGYISAQELKVNKPTQIKCSLFHTTEPICTAWRSDLERVSCRDLQLLPSVLCRSAAPQLPTNQPTNHDTVTSRGVPNNVACICCSSNCSKHIFFPRLSWATCLRSTRGRCPLRSWRSTLTPW